jgi:hypothetical protein
MNPLNCGEERRRHDVRSAPLFGLDFVEVSDDQRSLEVLFLGKAPPRIQLANVQISGGRRIRDIRAVSVRAIRQTDPTLDDALEVRVNKPGDFSDYRLSLLKLDDNGNPTDKPMDGFDPLFSWVDFNFKAGCPTDLDCKTQPVCPPPQSTESDINYLAKDYGSFRQLILDRLALIMPQWQETHVPDIGVMLVELLAYAGDYLSQYQDAVATEAYLGTARQRISVRRHARLVDYRLHEGSNARAWVTIQAGADTPLDARQIFFTTALPGKPGQRVFQALELERIPTASYLVFEPLMAGGAHDILLYQANNEIHFYTWGDCECCLPRGATSATLADAWVPVTGGGGTPGTASAGDATETDGPPGTRRALHLAVGDVLIFEEVAGPQTGNPADADPAHRQAVRLTKATRSVDPLYHPSGPGFGHPVVEIEWCSEDALAFPLCLSAKMPPPDCTCRENISVARGNVILVDHGTSTSETPLGTVPAGSTTEHCACDCQPAHVESIPGKFCPQLRGRPLTFSQPLPQCGCASTLLVQDPRQALPQVTELKGTLTTAQGPVATYWTPQADLLESGPNDANFVVETDDEGVAHLRFGQGGLGRQPGAGTVFDVRYRVGNGTGGNVGAETITCLVFRQTTGDAGPLAPRNPLPAAGGIDREPVEEAKMFAPVAFRKVLERAITAADYADLAADNQRRLKERARLIALAAETPIAAPVPPSKRAAQEEEPGEEAPIGPEICAAPFVPLQSAKARLRWTGSWREALVALDPRGSEDAGKELIREIAAYLEPYRRIGHDLVVQQAQYVGIDLALRICVLPDYLRGHVEQALLDVFSNRMLADGTMGFFHPDNLTFGEGIPISQIIASAQRVTGVQEAEVLRLERFEIGEPALGTESPAVELPAGGILSLGPFEIARLDNDPDYPENGRLTLVMGGGQ